MNQLVTAGALLRALAPEMLLSVGAMVMLLLAVWRTPEGRPELAEGGERTGQMVQIGLALCLFAALIVGISWGDGAPGTADLRLAGDGFRWAMDLVILAGTAATLALIDADHRRSGAYAPETPVLVLLAAVGMMVLAAARDLMFIFLGIELMSLAIYVLAGLNRRSARGAEAAIKYFLLGAVSTGFLLYGMALLYGATGSTRLVDIAQWIAAHPALSPLFVIGTALLLVGLAFKVAAAPFHLWTPDVYEGAPMPITAFMSATVKTAAFAALSRVMIEALAAASQRWHLGLWWLAALTMIVGNVLALSQRQVVRMLAYSSIAHAGYLLVAVLVGAEAGTTAVVFYTVSYTLATMGVFAVLVTVSNGRDLSLTVDDVAGLWMVRPWLATAMGVFLLALLGMPLVGGMGFFAKWYILQAALQASTPQTILSVILVVTSAISAGYYLVLISAMFMRPRPEGQPVPATAPILRSIMTVAAVALLALGIYPTPLVQLARRATTSSRTGPSPDGSPGGRIRLQTAASPGAPQE
jgi:NADH-quinone oxidoreductase subunit N